MSELIIEDDRMRNQKSLMYKKTDLRGDVFYSFKSGEYVEVEPGFMIPDDCILPLDINTEISSGFFKKKDFESDIIVEIKRSNQSHVDNLNEILCNVISRAMPSRDIGEL